MANKQSGAPSKLVKLVKVGDFEMESEDPAFRPPAAVSKAFPKGAELQLATDGTWYTFVAEQISVTRGSKKFKETARRLVWLEGSQLRRGVDAGGRVDPPSFDRQRGVVLLIKNGTAVGELDLEGKAFTQLAVGIDWKKSDTRHYQDLHVLDADRVLVSIPREVSEFFVLAREKGRLVAKGQLSLFGNVTVADRRILVGGAEILSCVSLDPGDFRLLAQFPDVEVQSICMVGGRPRIYGGKGCFEVVGLDKAWARLRSHPNDFPSYAGSPE